MAAILAPSRAFNSVPGLAGELTAVGHMLIPVPSGPLSEADMIALGSASTAMIVGIEPVTAAVIASAPGLCIVARPGVGYDNVDVSAATAAGVLVTITPGANAESVADHTMALLLACARQVPLANVQVHAGGWPRLVGMELQQRTLGLLGLGQIGKGVACRAGAFGMQVMAHDPKPDREFAAAHGLELVEEVELIERAEVLSLHLPLTSVTRHMVDAPFLARLRPGAILINTARGELVDESAVAAALASGHLAAAGLDVMAREPPTGSPLLGKPGAVLTPHIAAYTEAALERMARMAVYSVIDALTGRVPQGLVNPDALNHSRWKEALR